jgi:hypothetical protein
MTDAGKTRFCWILGLGGGIPLTVLLTWVFTAGILRADFDVVRDAAFRAGEQNQTQEMRIQRLEVHYEHLRGATDEIKADVKEIRRMLERRP